MTLRKVTNIHWSYVERKEGPVFRKQLVRYYRCAIGKSVLLGANGQPLEWAGSVWHSSMERQQQQPLRILATKDGRQHWVYRGENWWDDEQLTSEDVQALVAERERQQRARLERAHLNQQ